MHKNVRNLWKKPGKLGGIQKRRLVEWRKDSVVNKVKNPTRADRARSLGYKAKQGFVIARVRVKKGARKRPKPAGGRRPAASGRFVTLGKSKQVVAQEKAARKFPNLEVLNSYPVGDDGVTKWFEVILIDRSHPVIKKDKRIKWISSKKGRAFRGLTSAKK
jgi:large subunit ribosomal protein L15e